MSNLVILNNNKKLGNIIESILKCISTHSNNDMYIIEIREKSDCIVFSAIHNEDKYNICEIRIYYTEKNIFKNNILNGKAIHISAKKIFNNFKIDTIFNKDILERELSSYLKIKFTDFDNDELCESIYILHYSGFSTLHGVIDNNGRSIYSDEIFNQMNWVNNKNNMQAAAYRLCMNNDLNFEQLNDFLIPSFN